MATGRKRWVGRGLVALGLFGGVGLLLETMPGSVEARLGTSIAAAASLGAEWSGVRGDFRGDDHAAGLHLANAPLDRHPPVPIAGDENFWLSPSPFDGSTTFPLVIGSRFGVTAPSGTLSTFEIIAVEPITAADHAVGSAHVDAPRYVSVLCRDVSETTKDAPARTLRFLVEAGSVTSLTQAPRPHAL